MRRIVSSIGLALLAFVGACGPSGYDVVIVAKDGLPLAEGRFWELAIREDGCPQSAPAEDPASAALVRVVRWRHGEPGPALGNLAPGGYGFQARVRDATCAVRWAGCRSASLEEDGGGRIEVLLADVDGPGCDEGHACEGRERCDPEVGCVLAEASACSDEVDCTADHCVEPTGCQYLPEHGRCAAGELCGATDGCVVAPSCGRDADCSDAFVCNGPEACIEDRCAPGPAPECDDGVACTVDACAEPAGCQHRPDHGACGAAELCDPALGCVRGAVCEEECEQDGRFCNGPEICVNGVCSAGAEPDCRDDVGCTADACDPVLDACRHVPNDEACATHQLCTTGVCDAADGCVPVDVACDDHDPCTFDYCIEGLGCVGEPGDVDGDGVLCPEDCNNYDPDVYPGAAERCNLVDDDCDAWFDNGCNCWPMFRDEVEYILCWGDVTWADAQATCQGYGGSLAVPRDEDEQAWITQWVFYAALKDWWIGANDSAEEDVWTDAEGEPISFFDWAEGHPGLDDARNCVALSATLEGAWIDAACDELNAIVCRLP